MYFISEADQSLLSHADVQNERICTSTPASSSWCATLSTETTVFILDSLGSIPIEDSDLAFF
jgi:hypothetical protein